MLIPDVRVAVRAVPKPPTMSHAALAGVFPRRSKHSKVIPGGAALSGLSLLAALTCATGISVGGAVGLTLTSAATLAATWVVLRVGCSISPTLFCFRTVAYVYGSQTVAQLLLALTNATAIPTGWGNTLVDNAGVLVVSQFCLLAATLLAVALWGSMVPQTNSKPLDLTQRPPAQAQVALVIALLLHMSQTILRLILPESWFWVLSVFTEDLEAVAFFVGWFEGDFGAVTKRVVRGALIVNCGIGGLRGVRYPIVLLGLYLVGRLFSPRERHRRGIICGSLAGAVPILFWFAIIGDIRVKRGQETLDLLSPSRWSDFVEAVSASRSSYQTEGKDAAGATLSRLYAWPNAASVILTPDVVPYRGFKAWATGCLPYLQIGTWSAEARRLRFEDGVGTQQASMYGFVSRPGSTVEFGVLADGWSTAGPVGVLVLGGLVMLALCMSEELVLHRLRLSYMGKLVFLCILVKACIQCYVYPAPLVLRYVVLYSCFWMAVLKLADMLGGIGQGKSRQTPSIRCHQSGERRT